jgi:hypothetical protein
MTVTWKIPCRGQCCRVRSGPGRSVSGTARAAGAVLIASASVLPADQRAPVVRAIPSSSPSPSRRRAAAARRRLQRLRRRRWALGVGLVAALTVLGGAVYGPGRDFHRTPAGAPTTQARAVPTVESPVAAAPPAAAPPAAETVQPTPTASPVVAGKGLGTFTTVQANGPVVGTGETLRRYKVEVEDGIGVDPVTTARQVQDILADSRSWTTDGKNSFQLVASGGYDFTVRIASPEAVDRICATAGLDTGGEVNCNVDRQVMVNIKRWTTGSPKFSGPIEDYRALIINHEVGHRIGRTHLGCPGPGQPAPAMMQQIYGLEGCVSNAWPYSAAGAYLGGPARP